MKYIDTQSSIEAKLARIEGISKNSSARKPTISFTIDSDLLATLDSYCKRRNINRSGLISSLLREYLVKQGISV